jgi:hypothetical protein
MMSSPVTPRMRSALALQEAIVPSRSYTTMPSSSTPTSRRSRSSLSRRASSVPLSAAAWRMPGVPSMRALRI